MPPLLYLCMCVSLSLFALLRHSLGHGRSTSESLYEEEMVIASSLQTSEWPDLTGSLLQPLWLSIFEFKVSWTFPKWTHHHTQVSNGKSVFPPKKSPVCVNTLFPSITIRLPSITRLDALQLCYTIWCVVINWYVCASTFYVGLDVWNSHGTRQKAC